MSDNTSRPGDTDNALLRKIVAGLGGIPLPGDSDVTLLKKLDAEVGGEGFPSDSKNNLYFRICSDIGGNPQFGDDTNKFLFRIVDTVGGEPVVGDTDNDLLRKFNDVIQNSTSGFIPDFSPSGISGGNAQITVTISDATIGSWVAFFVGYSDPSEEPSTFSLLETVQVTSNPFVHTVSVPSPSFSPAQICVRMTVGTTPRQAQAKLFHDFRSVCYSYPSEFVTPPGVPTGFNVTPHYSSILSATVAWTPPATGGIPDFYDIYRRTNGGSYSLIHTVNFGINDYTDPGLDYNVYDYFVQARNAGGSSSASNTGTGDFSLDTEVANWKDRVLAASEQLTNSTLHFVNVFMLAIKSAGIRSKILRCNLFCGFGVGAAKIPLIIDAGNAVDADYPTAGGGFTYSEAAGLNRNVGSGNSRALGTGFVPATALSADNDAHFSVYVITGNTETTFACGVQDGVPNDWALIGPSYTGVGTRLDCWKTGTAVADANGKGFYLGNRISADAALYKNGVLLQNSVAPGGVRVVTYPMVFFGLNTTGTDTGTVRSTKTLGGYTLGKGLTAQNITDLYTAMQNFQVSLGRGV